MRSGRCPKCQSTDVRTSPADLSDGLGLNTIQVSFWRSITPELRVCVACGYVEHYVASPSDRVKIAAKWPA